MPRKIAKPPAAPKHRIFLVEDHPVTREGFAQLLDFNPDLHVCGQAASARKALEGISAIRPELVVVDLSLADGNGLDLVKALRTQFSKLAILVLSTHDETLYAERALRSGADGYVMKQSPTADVLKAVRQVLGGAKYLSETMNGRLLQKLAQTPEATATELAVLSDRELQVLELIGEGRTTSQIARLLALSVSTVETHRANLKRKLKLASGMELVRYAVAWTSRVTR